LFRSALFSCPLIPAEAGIQSGHSILVIASEAKQSRPRRELDCVVASLLAMTIAIAPSSNVEAGRPVL